MIDNILNLEENKGAKVEDFSVKNTQVFVMLSNGNNYIINEDESFEQTDVIPTFKEVTFTFPPEKNLYEGVTPSRTVTFEEMIW